jgi:hypothetical protein
MLSEARNSSLAFANDAHEHQDGGGVEERYLEGAALSAASSWSIRAWQGFRQGSPGTTTVP